MMGFFTELLKAAKEQSLNQVQIITDRSLEKVLPQIVLGQAHRGRLNLLTGLLGFPPVETIIAQFHSHVPFLPGGNVP